MYKGRTQRPKGSAFQNLQDQLKWVDLIFEVRDARLPQSSGHPRAKQIFSDKPRLIVLAKQDLADEQAVSFWLTNLSQTNSLKTMSLSLKQSRGKDKVIKLALELTAAKREALMKRGLLPRPMRACVVGMPNVGKSSFINWLIGQKRAKVGDRPGVTKGTQWVRLHSQLELLDSPGILPHEEFCEGTRLKLALLNLLPDSTYDQEQVVESGLPLIESMYPSAFSFYGLDPGKKTIGLIELAQARNCLARGGKPDTRRAASIFLNDLREGRLGRLTLDLPPVEN